MGLAGILTIALIVSADQSYAGIDGLRAIRAYPPSSEQDPTTTRAIPVLTGLLDGIRELPIFGAPEPVAPPSATAAPAAPGVAAPAAAPSVATPVPAAGSTPPITTPTPSQAPSASPSPSPTPAPSVTPSPAPPATPTPAPSPTPAPGVALTTDRGASAIVALGDLVPGDLIDRTITLKNTGTLGFRYTVSASQTASTLLWTDTTQGLQLSVATTGGLVLYAGPLSGIGSLTGPTMLASGASETLRYTFTFPASAPDSFQGLIQDLTLVFTATQFP